MPVTFYPAESIKAESRQLKQSGVSVARATFESAASHGDNPTQYVLHSSFPKGVIDPKIVPTRNGFVDTVLEAYNRHRMLIIRPDDVWISILAQFNNFVNANAESLRHLFVAHDDKKKLQVVTSPAKDVEIFVKEIMALLKTNVADPALREWIIPNFTTTTDLDKTVASIIMMATLQKYFSYCGGWDCGLPAVTLEGTKKDWQSILRRIEKLKEYGMYTTAWYHLLRPVLKRFVNAFDEPSNDENLKFWCRVIHQHGGSGGPWISGWITAFCVFDAEGRWVGPTFKDSLKLAYTDADTELDSGSFWEKYMDFEASGHVSSNLELDGAVYRKLHMNDIAPGCIQVPVVCTMDGPTNCTLTAGLGAYTVSSSNDQVHSKTGEYDTVQPVMGWWLSTAEVGLQDEGGLRVHVEEGQAVEDNQQHKRRFKRLSKLNPFRLFRSDSFKSSLTY